jgi:exodeoxyribonuclease V alpha subunit
MKGNCITIHKLLEYKPEYYTIVDPETGKEKTARKFVPSRTSFRPLPKSIKTIIIDESSMVGTDLFALILDALKHKVQFIFIGDIQQLPPIFSSAILGYKILELENSTVELTQVYRQALESPIIRLAHRILSGVPIKTAEFSEWKIPNKLTLHPWKKRISEDSANLTFAAFIRNAIDTNNFDIENDIILIPFNKAFGTDEINKVIATHLAKKENKVVYEIIAGFNRRYFAVGDRVLYDKEDAIIKHIRYNSAYSGALPQKESPMMDYWGRINIPADETHHLAAGETNEDIDFMLQQVSAANKDEDRVHASSHVITLEMLDTGDEEVLDTASDINSLMHGYALTIHKAQGSEWRKVLLVLHNSHATMIQRELLYTGVTRAKEELYVICEPETFVKGITNQRIQGNTLKEKAEYFKGKIANGTGNNK